jgi:hypothetical protein
MVQVYNQRYGTGTVGINFLTSGTGTITCKKSQSDPEP